MYAGAGASPLNPALLVPQAARSPLSAVLGPKRTLHWDMQAGNTWQHAALSPARSAPSLLSTGLPAPWGWHRHRGGSGGDALPVPEDTPLPPFSPARGPPAPVNRQGIPGPGCVSMWGPHPTSGPPADTWDSTSTDRAQGPCPSHTSALHPSETWTGHRGHSPGLAGGWCVEIGWCRRGLDRPQAACRKGWGRSH